MPELPKEIFGKFAGKRLKKKGIILLCFEVSSFQGIFRPIIPNTKLQRKIFLSPLLTDNLSRKYQNFSVWDNFNGKYIFKCTESPRKPETYQNLNFIQALLQMNRASVKVLHTVFLNIRFNWSLLCFLKCLFKVCNSSSMSNCHWTSCSFILWYLILLLLFWTMVSHTVWTLDYGILYYLYSWPC